jgi:hypothetical protein
MQGEGDNKASDRMKAPYNHLAGEGDQLWLYYPIQIELNSCSLLPSWKGPYRAVTGINDMV